MVNTQWQMYEVVLSPYAVSGNKLTALQSNA